MNSSAVYIELASSSIPPPYRSGTGRILEIGSGTKMTNVAFVGDSTLDNGFWVDPKVPYARKIHTVPFQVAHHAATCHPTQPYRFTHLAVDGATTKDVLTSQKMSQVIRPDEDHPAIFVKQLEILKILNPNTTVLSVGGNDYRVTLQSVLLNSMPLFYFFCRLTPEFVKPLLKEQFNNVKMILLENYKRIIDRIIEENSNLQRLILVSQYYPMLTMLTPYFIYTGFSHIAASEGSKQTSFQAIQTTMESLYNDIIQYVASKNKEIIFVDMTSSLNPVKGYFSHQIEPNERGSRLMGKIIAAAVMHQFSSSEQKRVILRLARDESTIETLPFPENERYSVRSINDFISANRYNHLFPSRDSSFIKRTFNVYCLFAGKHFDAEYKGVFALGLLDLSLVTLLAAYLWRVALNAKHPTAIRCSAALFSTPILVARFLCAAILTIALLPCIFLFHSFMHLFQEKLPEREFIFGNNQPSI